jgi:hypothetical protein
MTLASYRSDQPLFTVIVRDTQARDWLTRWTQTSRSIHARVEDNRMHIFDHNTFSMFIVTWTHSWDHVMIWDPWSKRHISW